MAKHSGENFMPIAMNVCLHFDRLAYSPLDREQTGVDLGIDCFNNDTRGQVLGW
jgi:hypothetical protein